MTLFLHPELARMVADDRRARFERQARSLGCVATTSARAATDDDCRRPCTRGAAARRPNYAREQ